MERDYFSNDELDKILDSEYKGLPNVEVGPGGDFEDAGYKVIDILANDLALDTTELDLEGLNWYLKPQVRF